MSLSDIVMAAIETAPAETLMKSRRNCHVRGLDSVVIRECPVSGALTRMFIACPNSDLSIGWGAHRENKNPLDSAMVGVHEHKYMIRLQRIVGHALHLECAAVHMGSYGSTLMYAHTVGGFSDAPVMHPMQRVIKVIHKHTIEDMMLMPEVLHTVVADTAGAAWLVTEGPRETDRSRCYSRLPMADMEMAGLYKEYKDREDVIYRTRKALSKIEQNNAFSSGNT